MLLGGDLLLSKIGCLWGNIHGWEMFTDHKSSYHRHQSSHFLNLLWVVKVERFQWNERPSCAHATSKVDQCCVQLVSSKLVFFSFDFFVGFALPATLCDFVFRLCLYHVFMIAWKDNERRMKGTWKQMNPKVWVLIPFDVVRYVVRTSFGRRSKQLPSGKLT